ncbi:hypothetical protein ES703_109306 [subsurface metagenome]
MKKGKTKKAGRKVEEAKTLVELRDKKKAVLHKGESIEGAETEADGVIAIDERSI